MNSSANMRVVIGYGSGADSARLRQTVLGAGLECVPEDCVTLSDLEGRLAQGAGDLVIVAMGDDGDRALETVRTSSRFSMVPVWAVGPTNDSELVVRTLRSGAREYLSSGGDLHRELDSALEKWASARQSHQRGAVISLYAPVPGSGATTVATNIAAALARSYANEVALVELQREGADLATLLDFVPQHTVSDVCRRWQALDTTCLQSSLLRHRSGVRVLPHETAGLSDDVLRPEAIRRIAILSRRIHRFTVIDLDSCLAPPQLEALRLSDWIGFVVRPDVPCLRCARRTFEELQAHGVAADSLRLIVNRSGQPGGLPVKIVEQTLGMPVTQTIPDAPGKVNRAVNQGALLEEVAATAKISRCFRKLAKQIDSKE